MNNQKIWFALVGVKPTKGNDIIPNSAGAYANVACVSQSEDEFKNKLQENFKHHKFKIFEIEEIETEETMDIDDEENSEKILLLNEIKEGYQFAWGTFHLFDNQ